MSELLQMKDISKIYGNGIYANKHVNFSIRDGEIHALVGENGAGKSTLMKILFGLEKPSSGEIILQDKKMEFHSPQDAMAVGIGMVHQHFMLVESLSVTENIILGCEPIKGGFIDYKTARGKVREFADTFDMKIDPEAIVSDLSVGIKQKVEIIKSLFRGAKILILDEPTAVLTPQETTELFLQLKNLKERGYTVIFISHKLREVKEISDRVSIMRKGELIRTVETGSVTEKDISVMMVGSGYTGDLIKTKAEPKKTLLSIRNLKFTDTEKQTRVGGVSFDLRSGEITGIAGVEGNGQNELIQMITGLAIPSEGKIEMLGRETTGQGIGFLRDLGMAYIPSDRMSLGVTPTMSIEENLITTKIKKPLLYNKFKLLDKSKIHKLSAGLVEEYRIKCNSAQTPVEMLSGGNIQKVVVAREFTQDNTRLIIAEQPTRGIDVGAAKFIHEKLISLRDSGYAVLLVSADLEELYKLSDSILVMFNGRISAYIEAPETISETELGHYMLGVNKQSEEEVGRACHEE
jgi:simple sugar transport system ATP-binding protein